MKVRIAIKPLQLEGIERVAKNYSDISVFL